MDLERFQMIDSIGGFDPEAQRLQAECVVPIDSSVFEGHFPGHPLMPGVLLVETMAQASGYLVLALNDFGEMPFLVGIKEAKLRVFVDPGATIRVESEIEHLGSGFVVTNARVQHEDTLVCSAKLTFKLLPFPVPELRDMLWGRANKIGLLTQAMAS